MPDVKAGMAAPDFTLPSTKGSASLKSLLAESRSVVLAFYTEDGTPSCQTALSVLKDAHAMLREFGAEVLAVSADSLESHHAFADRLGGVPFPLAADEDLTVARTYGVIDEGDPRRARRAVFVIHDDGIVSLAVVPFQPGNLAHIEAIFAVLGADA